MDMRLLLLVVISCIASGTAARAEDLCPEGPFETDVRVIAADISAHPLKPRVWDSSRDAGQLNGLTDGATWNSAGGLLVGLDFRASSLSYDAKRYVVLSYDGYRPMRGVRSSRAYGPLENQFVRRRGRTVETTTVARPTPEQARRFACIANRMVGPPSPESSIDAQQTQKCSDWAGDSMMGSDSAEDGSSVLSHGAMIRYDPRLPCETREALFFRLRQLTDDILDEAIARARHTWRASYVESLGTDAADNLYLLVNTGTLEHRAVDIWKMSPRGDMTHLVTPTAETFYDGTFAVDGRGHAWVSLNLYGWVPPPTLQGAELYDIPPRTNPDYVVWGSEPKRPDSTLIRTPVDSVAVDINNYVYALSGSRILQITYPGTATPLVDIPQLHKRQSSHQPGRLAVAPGIISFIADPSSNVILKVTKEHVVTIFAGIPGRAGRDDGPGDKARFNAPEGLVVDRNGTLYVADTGNHTIRRITPEGLVSTFVGRR